MSENRPATPQEVFYAMEVAVRRQFGSAAELERIAGSDQRDEGRYAHWGFTVDGTDYSLMLNVTE